MVGSCPLHEIILSHFFYYFLSSLLAFCTLGKNNLEFMWTPAYALFKVNMLYFNTLISLEK